MDIKGDEMRQQMDDTVASLTGKLEDLGDQVSGTVRTVRKSMNSVRDTFDVPFQVREHPFTAVAGATALGFLTGFRPNGKPTRNGKPSVGPVAGNAPSDPCAAGATNHTNGGEDRRSHAAAAPSWLANLEETFKPEIIALRGVAVGALFGVVREAIMKQGAKPTPGSAGESAVSESTLADQERKSR